MSSGDKTVAKRLEAFGRGIFHITLRMTGQAGAYLLLLPVVFFYVLFSRRIHQCTRPYRARRMPERTGAKAWVDTFRIVLSFGQVLVDVGWLGMKPGKTLDGILERQDELIEMTKKGKGLVLITAHVGNWQTALAHISGFPAPVNSLMHYEQEAVAKHYFDMRNEPLPFNIINNEGFMGGMVEATVALQKGEIVTIMGDRYTKGPFAKVKFLNSDVRLPSAAYNLAVSTGAPVAILLAAKKGRKRYILHAWDIFYPEKSDDRNRRKEELEVSASRFAGALEEYTALYPYQWYNFYDFWSQ